MRDDDRGKFKRLAEARVTKAMKAIQLIGNLSNRSNYDYTDEDVNRIFKALNEEISACRQRFEFAQKKTGNKHFSLD